jgi:hypothetical protein
MGDNDDADRRHKDHVSDIPVFYGSTKDSINADFLINAINAAQELLLGRPLKHIFILNAHFVIVLWLGSNFKKPQLLISLLHGFSFNRCSNGILETTWTKPKFTMLFPHARCLMETHLWITVAK